MSKGDCMARPRATKTSSKPPATAAVEKRVVALAEQLGRLVGTVQAKADGWVDLPALNTQLMRIRDGAAGILGQMRSARSQSRKGKGRKPTAKAAGRSGGKVDAPGKTHRKPPTPTRAVKKSDEMIPKAKAASRMRRAPRG
jgi:hypothetical protein